MVRNYSNMNLADLYRLKKSVSIQFASIKMCNPNDRFAHNKENGTYKRLRQIEEAIYNKWRELSVVQLEDTRDNYLKMLRDYPNVDECFKMELAVEIRDINTIIEEKGGKDLMQRKKVMDELAEQAQELDMGY